MTKKKAKQAERAEIHKLAVEADEKALDKNPYATRRMIAAVATVVSLAAYFLIPAVGYEAIRLAVLVVFFLLITVCTYFQMQYRGWKEMNRTYHELKDKR